MTNGLGGEHSQQDKLLAFEFINLEIKYQDWFNNYDTFIEDYFIDKDFTKDFIAGCELPEHVKIEVLLIKSRFGL